MAALLPAPVRSAIGRLACAGGACRRAWVQLATTRETGPRTIIGVPVGVQTDGLVETING